MKKNYFLYLIIFITPNLNVCAQNFLIPFKSNDKYGLINNQKKVIIEPSYKNMEYVQEDYFEGTSEEKYTEKISFNGNEQDYNGTLTLKSLFKKDRIIINKSSLEKFYIYNHYIIGVNNFRSTNLKYNQYKEYEDIKAYSILFDRNGKESELGKLRSIEGCLQLDGKTIFRIQKLDKKYDLIVFDYNKNKVIDVIISNSDDYFFVYILNNNSMTKVRIVFEKTKKKQDYVVDKNSLYRQVEIEIDSEITVDPKNIIEEDNIPSEIVDNANNGDEKKAKYLLSADYVTSKIDIYTIENNKIVLQPDNNNLFYLRRKPYIVNKNSKYGLYNTNYKEIIPIKYDSIGFNGMVLQIKNFNYLNQNKEFVVVKENNKYGVLKINQNNKSYLYEIEYFLKPILTNYPVFYYKDYYGIKDLNLFQVIDNQGNLTQFCDENGNCY